MNWPPGISTSRARARVLFAPWWTSAPAIVAEALVGVPDALLTALNPGPPAPAAAVAGALARSLSPPEHSAPGAAWLLPEQRRSFARILAAIERYGGALLADPVGSGKTFVALAVAAALNRAPTACLVPAALLPQWQATADRLAIPIRLYSHQQISRGRLPRNVASLVLIDESHHFRNPHSKRYQHLAPWLVGRHSLLVSATPVVNSLLDLAHQLLLTVRDDALAWDGAGSLQAVLADRTPLPALGQLVVESEMVHDQRPGRTCTSIIPGAVAAAAYSHEVEMVDRLRLSISPPIAALIRVVLLRSLASSPAAFECALRRYRRLLLHARDAMRAGQVLDRTELRAFTGELGDQLVWWELLPEQGGKSDIALEDLEILETLIQHAEGLRQKPDEKLERLAGLLRDSIPTLVFAASRDTVRYIRERLSDQRLAWCTGSQAGIGNATMSRAGVLRWFQQPTDSSLAPTHLIVTDVAAEGLDLQRGARVVHYDLPWTPMRIEQREGRSIRYGSRYSEVAVVQFATPPVLERRLRLEAGLAYKAGLPAAVGLGPTGGHVWRWRAQLAARFQGIAWQHGVAMVTGFTPGLLAGFALYLPSERMPLSATVIWMEPNGRWTESPGIIGEKLEIAAAQPETPQPDPARVSEWVGLLAGPIRDRLNQVKRNRWRMVDPAPGARQIIERLQRLIRDAARSRQRTCLTKLEAALAAVAGGHTAGEAMLLERLARVTDSDLVTSIAALPAQGPDCQGLEVRLTGMVIFGPAHTHFTKVPSPEWPGSTPHFSTSMEP